MWTGVFEAWYSWDTGFYQEVSSVKHTSFIDWGTRRIQSGEGKDGDINVGGSGKEQGR